MADNHGESSMSALDRSSEAVSLSKNGKGKSKGNGNGSSSGGVSPTVDFTAGVIAGAAGLIVGQPFDVVKVRYQTPQYQGRYGSTFSALGAIVKEEKVKGLFKGVTSPMAGIAFINGVVFTSYSFFMKLQLPEGSDKDPTLGQIFLAGSGSGVAASLLTCPTELIKIRQQSAPPHLNPSTLSVLRSIIQTNGVRGVFRGFTATAMRDLAYGPYFCTYEAVLRLFKWAKPPPPPSPSHAQHHPHHHHHPNANHHDGHTLIDEAEMELQSGLGWPELMLAGGIAGVTAWIATFPIDVFKTRMQSAPWPAGGVDGAGGGPPTFTQVAREAIRKEGWRVMFAGLGPTLIRAVPTNMVIFLTFEAVVGGLSR